mgnify:CR=1 FL=1
MKFKSISILAWAAAAAAFTGCSDNWVPEVEGAGEGRLNTQSILAEVNTVEDEKEDEDVTKKATSRSSIDLSPFLVDVVRTSDNANVASWTYATMPQLPTFAVGSYKVQVRSRVLKDAEWSAPYYLGSQTFDIRNGEVTDVGPIVCKLANVRVTIDYGPKLLEATGGEGFTITVTSTPGVYLQYTGKETRSGYFAYNGQTTMVARFQGRVNGVNEDFSHVLENIAPGQHRKLTFRLNYNPNVPDDEVGTIEGQGIVVSCSTKTVNVDGNVIQEEDIQESGDRPGQEEKPKPEDPQPGDEDKITFTSETLDHDDNGNVRDDTPNNADDFGEGKKEAKIHIHSEAPIASLNVKIVSNFLTEDMLSGVGLTSEFDLANPVKDGTDYTEGLKGLGFKVGDEVKGETDLDFDITTFMPLIAMAGDHKFIITVKDENGVSKTLSLLIRKS